MDADRELRSGGRARLRAALLGALLLASVWTSIAGLEAVSRCGGTTPSPGHDFEVELRGNRDRYVPPGIGYWVSHDIGVFCAIWFSLGACVEWEVGTRRRGARAAPQQERAERPRWRRNLLAGVRASAILVVVATIAFAAAGITLGRWAERVPRAGATYPLAYGEAFVRYVPSWLGLAMETAPLLLPGLAVVLLFASIAASEPVGAGQPS